MSLYSVRLYIVCVLVYSNKCVCLSEMSRSIVTALLKGLGLLCATRVVIFLVTIDPPLGVDILIVREAPLTLVNDFGIHL